MNCRNLLPIKMNLFCRACCDTDIGSTEPWTQPLAGAACCGQPTTTIRDVLREWLVRVQKFQHLHRSISEAKRLDRMFAKLVLRRQMWGRVCCLEGVT